MLNFFSRSNLRGETNEENHLEQWNFEKMQKWINRRK